MSAAGRRMAADLADKLPPPDKLKGYRPAGDEGEGADEDEGDMGAEAHASALLEAISAKDPAGIVSAFRDLSAACSE